MLFLLILPIVALATIAQRSLQTYAPSNVLIARARTATPRWRAAIALFCASSALIAVAHWLSTAIASGAPAWLNLVVLILTWDVIKFALLAVGIALRAAGASLAPRTMRDTARTRSKARRGPSRIPHTEARPAHCDTTCGAATVRSKA